MTGRPISHKVTPPRRLTAGIADTRSHSPASQLHLVPTKTPYAPTITQKRRLVGNRQTVGTCLKVGMMPFVPIRVDERSRNQI